MFEHLLVPYDGSGEAERAVAIAHALAKPTHGHITLMRVVSRSLDETEFARIESALQQLAAALREDGITTKALVVAGDPADTIVARAGHDRPDLVVLAPHHRHWLDALLRRSTTALLLSRSPAPLLVWPGGASRRAGQTTDGDVQSAASVLLKDPASLIVVPLDGSAAAERALPVAATFAARSGRAIVLLRVVSAALVAGSSGEVAELERAATLHAEREALAYLRSVRQRLARGTETETDRVCVQTMVRVGGAAEGILDLAHTHAGSLIVMGTHGQGSATMRAVLGSVALAVNRQARVPVIIVPEHATTPAHETDEVAVMGRVDAP